jgi:cytidine deaminase
VMKKVGLSTEDHALVEAARETFDRLYIKDKHEVSAALRTHSGKVYTGIHIEASVGFADVCGEVSAICHALAHGEKDYDTIVAMWRRKDGTFELPSPCGRCRELISDFSVDTWIIMGTPQAPFKVRISELLPLKNP